MKYICPVCGDDMLKDIEETEALARSSGLIYKDGDPGGVAMLFPGKLLRLTGECNACDEKTITQFLKSYERK